MTKVKNPLIKSKRFGPLIYTERKNEKGGSTHNVRAVGLKPKKKKQDKIGQQKN